MTRAGTITLHFLVRRFVPALLLCCCCANALAANARSEGATVIVNEVRVLTLRTSVSGSSPSTRAKLFANRLAGFDKVSLRVTSTRRSSKLYANGVLVALITKGEAAAHGVSHKALGASWLVAIRNAFALPPIKLTKTAVLLPVGGSVTVPAVGRLARLAEWATQNPEVVSVSRAGASYTFSAKNQGSSLINVGSSEYAQTVSVRVMPYAAQFPQAFNVSVVGAPALASNVRGAIEAVLKTRTAAVPGASLTWQEVAASEVPSGERRTYTVRVKADSPDAFQSEGIVSVTVSNMAVAMRRESELWYCNEPENVQKAQSLFQADLRRDDPVRMLYHHINDSPGGLYLRVMAVNASSDPATLVIIPGDSKDKNPVMAGLMAADPFFRSWLSGSGEVVTIPAKCSLPIAFRRLAPQETSSGLCYLRLLPGGPESVSVCAEAVQPYELDAKWQAALRSPAPWHEVGASLDLSPTFQPTPSDLIFPKPFKDDDFTYRVGGNFSFFRIGQKPIERRDPGRALDGNFGVVYSITARAENPTNSPADVELVFETSAGYSGGLFAIDGDVVRLPLMASKAEARLAKFRLEPGGSKTISLSTIPLSGSSYPATLVLRPVSTLPEFDIARRSSAGKR